MGGAAYLADRAGELIRQAKIVKELRRQQPSEVIPIVPPRSMEVQTAAALRSGPGTDNARIGSVRRGARLEAVARWGEWYRVKTVDGEAWIHRRLVR